MRDDEPLEVLEVGDDQPRRSRPARRPKPGYPECPYCTGNLTHQTRLHPIAIVMLVNSALGAIFAAIGFGPQYLTLLLLAVPWTFATIDKVTCDDCELPVL